MRLRRRKHVISIKMLTIDVFGLPVPSHRPWSGLVHRLNLACKLGALIVARGPPEVVGGHSPHARRKLAS